MKIVADILTPEPDLIADYNPDDFKDEDNWEEEEASNQIVDILEQCFTEKIIEKSSIQWRTILVFTTSQIYFKTCFIDLIFFWMNEAGSPFSMAWSE